MRSVMKVCYQIALGFLNSKIPELTKPLMKTVIEEGKVQTDNNFILHPFQSEIYGLHPLT